MFLNFLLYATFILFSLGQLGRISFLSQQINGYLYEIPIFIILIYLSAKNLFKPLFQSINRLEFLYLFLIFSLLTFFIDLRFFNLQQNYISILYQLRLWFYFLFFVYFGFQEKKNAWARLRFPLLIFISLTAVSSVLQYIFYPDLRNLIYSGWDPHLYRMFGAFFDTSVAGAIYGLIFILVLTHENLIKNKYLKIFVLALFFIFIFLTYSRTLYIAIVLTSILIAIKNKQFKFLLILPIVLLILIFIMPKQSGEGVNLARTFSIESRIEDYRVAFNLWSKKPVIGYGYNRIRYVKELSDISSHAGASFHSSFLVILVTSGVVGLVLFIASLVQLSVISGGFIYVFFLSIVSLADNVLLHPMILFLFLILLVSNRKSL